MGEVLGGKVYGKLNIFKYFQDMCMIHTSNFGFRDPDLPATTLDLDFSSTRFRRNWLQKAGTSDGR